MCVVSFMLLSNVCYVSRRCAMYVDCCVFVYRFRENLLCVVCYLLLSVCGVMCDGFVFLKKLVVC